MPDARQQFSRELHLTTVRWRALLDKRLRPLGLTRSRWAVLVELAKADLLSQRQLASRLGVEAPTLVRLLDNLEVAGYIERIPDPTDRRTKRPQLTDVARKITEEISAISTDTRERLLRDVSAKDLETCRKVLATINDALDESDPQ